MKTLQEACYCGDPNAEHRGHLQHRSEPGAEGLRSRVAALLSSSMDDGWNYGVNAALDVIDGQRWDDVLNAATPPAEAVPIDRPERLYSSDPATAAEAAAELAAYDPRALETVEQDIVKRVEADPDGYQPFTHRKWAEALIAALTDPDPALSQASDDREADHAGS